MLCQTEACLLCAQLPWLPLLLQLLRVALPLPLPLPCVAPAAVSPLLPVLLASCGESAYPALTLTTGGADGGSGYPLLQLRLAETVCRHLPPPLLLLLTHTQLHVSAPAGWSLAGHLLPVVV